MTKCDFTNDNVPSTGTLLLLFDLLLNVTCHILKVLEFTVVLHFYEKKVENEVIVVTVCIATHIDDFVETLLWHVLESDARLNSIEVLIFLLRYLRHS